MKKKLSQETDNLKDYFLVKIKPIFLEIFQGIKASLSEKKITTLKLSFSRARTLIQNLQEDNRTPKFFLFCVAFALLFCFIWDFFTFGSIDKELNTKHTAKAISMMRWRNPFLGWNSNFKLRIARAALQTRHLDRAVKTINEVRKQGGYDKKYMMGLALEITRGMGNFSGSEEVTGILDGLSFCKDCQRELLYLYTIQGRQALETRELEKAYDKLNRAYELAKTYDKNNSSLLNRKRELAKVCSLRAEALLLEEKPNDAIKFYEESVSLYPDGLVFTKIGELYSSRKELTNDDIKKALNAYKEANAFMLNAAKAKYTELKNLLLKNLRNSNATQEEIDAVSLQYPDAV